MILEFKTEPMAHQLEYITKNYRKNGIGAKWSMGTGKTKYVIDLIRFWSGDYGGPIPTIIVAPKVALLNWLDEFKMHSNMAKYVCVLHHDSTDKKRKAMELGFGTGKRIFVINYDSLKFMRKELLALKISLIVADESQRIKNPSAKSTAVMLELSERAEFRIALSGTPITQTALDLWAQHYFLDHGATLGKSYVSFKAENFFDANAGNPTIKFPNYKIVRGKEDWLRAQFNQVWDVVEKSVVKDLPPFTETTIRLPVPAKQARLLKKLAKEFVAFLDEDRAIIAKNAASKQIRMAQITSGFCRLEDGSDAVFEENPKLEFVRDLLLGCDEKVIVWARFRRDIKLLLSEFEKYNPASIWGDTSHVDKEQAKFNTDPTCRLIICNPQSAATAINLIAASVAIYYSQDYNLERFIQSKARCYRKGSDIHDSISYYFLVLDNTIDQVVYKGLRYKEEMANAITERSDIEGSVAGVRDPYDPMLDKAVWKNIID